MSSTRALRLLNSVENGTTNSSQLENLLASTTGRLPELAVLFNVAGQASRITTNQKTVETLVSSQSALSVMVESGVMVNSIAQSPTARSAVKSAGASVLRRFLTSRHNDENVNSSWADDFAWTRQQLPSLGTASGMAETATWKALTFGNGKYVAIGYDTSAVAVSSDGVSWTLGQMPLTLKYTSAAYGGPGGNERFVAVADGTSTYVHSTDGLIWTAASLPKIANWQHVYFRAGKFTAVASNNTEVATSTDGLSWTIAASNNIFTQTKTVAGGAQGSAVTLALSGTGTATVPSGVTTLNVTGRGAAGSDSTPTPVNQALIGNGSHVVPVGVTSITVVGKGGAGTYVAGTAGSPASYSGTLWTTGATDGAGGNSIASTPSQADANAQSVTYQHSDLGTITTRSAYRSSEQLGAGSETPSVRTLTVYFNDPAKGVTFTLTGNVNYTPAITGSPGYNTQGTSTTFTINGTTYTFAGGTGGAATQRTETITLPGTSALTGTYSIASGGQGNISYSTPGNTTGASASVTVNGTAYTFNGSANATTPNSRTDTITLVGNAPVAFTYSCPAGTLVSATFIASDVQIAANGTGTATIPAGTSKLKITATGAAGSEAITIAIPNTNGDPAWEAVAYGAGRYVAIRGTGSTQNVATSTDGATWTKANLPGATSGWTDITFGNGKFVAVRTSASDQLFAYSTDGITWSVVTPTALAPAAAGNWKKVAYGAGKFVAVGSGTSANVVYSTDGINWSTALIPGGLLWNGVTYGADRFVAVSFDAAANGANNIAYSTDGVTWTRTGLTGDSTARFTSIAFGGGKYLAVGNKQASSSDGVTWSVVGTAKNLTNVVYVLSQYVAFGAANGALAQYSADGVSWTNTSLGGGIVPSSGAFTIGAFGGSRFVIIASGNGQVAYSADARNFVTSTPQTTGANTVVTIAGVNYTFNGTTGANTPASRTDEVQLDINAPTSVTYNVASGASCVFAYSGGNSTQIINTPVTLLASAYNGSNKYVAVSYLENLVGYSADGVNWSVAVMPANVKWHGVSYGNGVFVAVAYDSSIAATSPDGSTWTQRAMPTSTKWGNVVYGAAGGHVALAEFSSINATTLDGITWTQRAMLGLPSTSIEDGQITNVPLSGSGSVIIPSGTTSVTINGRGAAGTDEVTTPIYGPDGVTWTNNLGLPASQQYRAAYGGDKIVAIRVGAASTNAYYSSNGVTWTAATLPNADWASVVYGNGKFVAVAKGSATTAYSTDGVTWTTGNSGVSSGAFKVIYGNNKFVAVNQQTSNNLFYSTDGITWTAGSINSGSSAWTSVIFANGKFVAIGVATSSNAAYSTDGINWNVVNSHSLIGADSAGIAFGNGKFVGFITSSGQAATVITTSSDGITWTNPTATGLGAGVGIQTADGVKSYGFIFVDGKFFIAARTTNVSNGIFQSTDGITWTASNGGTGDTHYWGDVVYTGDKLVAVGYSAVASVGISNNIIVGSQVVTPAVTGVGAAVNINSQSYTFTGSNTSTAPIARVETVSLNASAPTTVTYSAPAGTNVYLTYVALASSASPVTPLMPVQASWTEAAYGNGIFVAVATGSNIAATSPDGVNWTQQSLPVSTQWSHVSFSSGVFLAVSATGSIAATSPDGVTWTQRSLPQIATQGSGNSVSVALANNTGGGAPTNLNANPIRIRVIGNKLFSVGSYNGLYSSDDGLIWNKITTNLHPTAANFMDIAYGNGVYVANVYTSLGNDSYYGIYTSTDTINWTVRLENSTPGWGAVVFQGGIFLIAGSPNTNSPSPAIYTSPDGINWTRTNVTSVQSGYEQGNVTYGAGKHVVVIGNAVKISVTGGASDWTQYNLSSGNFRVITYGNGKFVALSSGDGHVATSTDGVNWTITQAATPLKTWASIAYGNGIFVAVSLNTDGNGVTAYSTNGITWTTGTTLPTGYWYSTVFKDGYFVTSTMGVKDIYFSTNGASWSTNKPNTSGTVTVPAGISTISLTGQGAPGTPGTAVNAALVNNVPGQPIVLPSSSPLHDIAYNNGVYIAISNATLYVVRSTDGETWTQVTNIGNSATPTRIVACNGYFYLLCPNAFYRSTDGVTWTATTAFSTNQNTFKGLAYGNGVFVAVCRNHQANSYGVYTSTDGVNWTYASVGGGNQINDVAFGAGKFVIVVNGNESGQVTNVTYRSTNGIAWTAGTLHSNMQAIRVVYDGTRFVTAYGDTVQTSTDGITWSKLPVMPFNNFVTFVATPSLIALGSANRNVIIFTTNNGSTWTEITYSQSGLSAEVSAFAYGGDRFVAACAGSTTSQQIALSKDGTSWSHNALPKTGTATIPTGVTTLSVTGKGNAGTGGAFTTIGNVRRVVGTASNGTFSVVLYNSGGVNNGPVRVMYTNNGNFSNSVEIAQGSNDIGYGVAYGNGKYVAVTQSPSFTTYTSTDGIAWSVSSQAAISSSGFYIPNAINNRVAFANGYFFVATTSGLFRSADGITWTQLFTDWTAQVGSQYSIMVQELQSNGTTIAVTLYCRQYENDPGIYYTVTSSNSGSTWKNLANSTNAYYQTAISAERLAYVANDGTIYCIDIQLSNQSPLLSSIELNQSGGQINTLACVDIQNQHFIVGYNVSNGACVYKRVMYQGSVLNNYTNPPGEPHFEKYYNNTVVTSGYGVSLVGTLYSDQSLSILTFYGGYGYRNSLPATTGANTTFTINGQTYTFAGSTGATAAASRTETITLSGSSSVNATYVVSSSGTLSLTYTPVTQGDPLVISVNGTNYTFAGSTTAGPATSRTETITGLGTGATTINYVMTPTKAATLAYTDAATTLSHAAWSATAYGNSTIVAVSSSGTHAAISADGTNWTKQVLPAGVGAADVVYGNNLFVAVGSSNKAATSSDGISWSQRPMPDNLNYKTVAFGNGKYVALASGGTSANVCAVSPDGITWTSVSLPVIADWKSIAFKDGLFFAVAANTDQALTSPDGSIWTKRTLPATANWAAVTASDKKFVAIANGSTSALVSFDGAKFNMSSPGSGGLAGSSANSKWGLLSYGAGVFVAIAKNSTVAAISSDGISWTDRTLPSDTAWNAITYANGKFVVLAENTTTAAYSADGSVWNPTTLPVSQRWVSVVAGPRLFVAIAKDTSVYLTSKDGITWTARNLPESGAWSSVRYGSGRYVITNDTTNKVLVSQDGITWTVNESASTGLNALAYGNGIFVGVASNDAGVDVSTDGYNWTQYGLPSISDWCAIRFGNGVFVALANNSAVVATSTDGVTWKQFNLPAAASWKAVAFGRGVFLGVSDSRTAVTNC